MFSLLRSEPGYTCVYCLVIGLFRWRGAGLFAQGGGGVSVYENGGRLCLPDQICASRVML